MRKALEDSRRSGFTLIELLAVLGIIALLAALLLSAIHVVQRQARKVKTTQEVAQIRGAWMTYLDHQRSFPAGIDRMNMAAINILSGKNPAANPRAFVYFEFPEGISTFDDVWGETYEFALDLDYNNIIEGGEWNGYPASNAVNAKVAVWSYGPDRQRGTGDDVTSWTEID